MESTKQIKQTVKTLAAEGRNIRVEKIRTTTGLERDAAWHEKRAVGSKARVALLAYAFARGRTYRSCEPKAGEDALDHLYSPQLSPKNYVAKLVARALIAAKAREGAEKEITEEVVAWVRASSPAALEAA